VAGADIDDAPDLADRNKRRVHLDRPQTRLKRTVRELKKLRRLINLKVTPLVSSTDVMTSAKAGKGGLHPLPTDPKLPVERTLDPKCLSPDSRSLSG
jgi:hypothetical protein